MGRRFWRPRNADPIHGRLHHAAQGGPFWILFLTGSQLALGACDFSKDKRERFVTLATAAFAVWNIGIAFVFGLAAYYAHKRGLFEI